MNSLTGVSNVAKAAEKHKQYKAIAALLGRLSLPALSIFWGPLASALPASIAWQIPLLPDERYTLEVAKDPGFSQIVVTAEVHGTGYSAELPDEGTYHWRLLRPARSVATSEGSTFVSGSFAALGPASDRERPAKLTWPKVAGADRYKLYVTDGQLKLKTILTESTFFVVDGPSEPLMIEVVAFTAGHRTDRAYHFEPGLTLDSGRPAAEALAETAAPPPAIAAPENPESPESPGSPAGPPAPAAAEPALVAEPPPPTPAVPLPPSLRERRRVYLVGLEAYNVDEQIKLTKLDVNLTSRGRYNGGGATVFTQPAYGLVVSAGAGYHEHKDKVRAEDVFPGKDVKVNASRYTLELAIGWDVLYGLDAPQHLLSVSLLSAATRLPLLPLVFDSTDGVPPALQKREESLLGGALAYGFFGAVAGLLLEGGYAVDHTDQAKLAYARGTLEFYPTDGLALLLGAYQRTTEATRCHSDRGLCLREGQVKTSVAETAGFAGIGIALR